MNVVKCDLTQYSLTGMGVNTHAYLVNSLGRFVARQYKSTSHIKLIYRHVFQLYMHNPTVGAVSVWRSDLVLLFHQSGTFRPRCRNLFFLLFAYRLSLPDFPSGYWVEKHLLPLQADLCTSKALKHEHIYLNISKWLIAAKYAEQHIHRNTLNTDFHNDPPSVSSSS